MAQTIRAFVAWIPPSDLVQRCIEVQGALRAVSGEHPHLRPRWVRPEQLHVTLRFLGEVTPAQLAELREEVQRLPWGAAQVTGLTLTAFPSETRARVVVLTLTEPAGWMRRWAEALEAAAARAGLPPEPREFRPHLTLTRLDAADVREWISGVQPPVGSWESSEIVGFRSELEVQGARYTRLWRRDEVPQGVSKQ
jgi:2'-5' RNA ligase